METKFDDAVAEANLYGFLARLWIAELDQETLDRIMEGGFREAYESLGGVIPASETEDISAVDQLAIEYCGCFLGPKGHLPPHQSVVAHSHFQGDCLSSLNAFSRIIGLPEGEIFSRNSMPDHAGVVLGMMQRICDTEATAEADDLADIAELRSRFFQSHVDWLIEYCRVASANSKSHFYSGLFKVTQGFLLEQRPVG